MKKNDIDTREIRRRYTTHIINLLYEKMHQKQKKNHVLVCKERNTDIWTKKYKVLNHEGNTFYAW